MTDKQIDTCEFLSICQTDCNGTLEDTEMCHCYELYKQLARKEQENEKLKETLKVIASRSCLNLYDCTGHCLPNCKWNAHVLAQQTLKELTSEVDL